MATNYPGALDTLTNPTSSDPVTNPDHAAQHADANDAIEAIQAKVGTGASTPTAGTVLRGTGAGTSAWSQVVLTSDVSGILPVANGGTGVSSLTASRALVSTAGGLVGVSAVTATELGYLTGVTSALQTQIDGKAASSHAHSAADITSGTLVIARGGTNSATALNNNRIMVSSGGAIVEAGAMTNGQLLIGSTSAAPVVAALTQGTGVTITNGAGTITIASSGGGVNEHIIYSTIFETAARHTVSTGGTGSVTFGTAGVDVSTGATATSFQTIQPGLPGANFDWMTQDSSFTSVFRILTAPTDGKSFVGIGTVSGNVTGTDITYTTTHHYGFKLNYASSSLTASCTSASGASETATAFTYGTASNTNLFYARFDAAVNIKFYMNNVLQATHSTNLPTALTSANFGTIAVSNVDTATTFALRVGSFLASFKADV